MIKVQKSVFILGKGFLLKKILAILVIGMMLLSCQPESSNNLSKLELNLLKAGPNRVELEKVLDHFSQNPNDSLKLKSAEILISELDRFHHFGGPTIEQFNKIFSYIPSTSSDRLQVVKDSFENLSGPLTSNNLSVINELRTIESTFLIDHIEGAYSSWQNNPWRDSVSFDMFVNYILPYKNYQETPSNWRSYIEDNFSWILQDSQYSESLIEATCGFNNQLKPIFSFTTAFDEYPGRLSFEDMLEGGYGNCGDMANLGAYVGRGLGIPVAIDYIPKWAAGDGNHAWNALLLNDNSSIAFIGSEGNPLDYTNIHDGEGRISKVRRLRLEENTKSFVHQAEQIGILAKDIPKLAMDNYTLDVTDLYEHVADIHIDKLNPKEKVVYLCLYYQGGWTAIEGSMIRKDGTAAFFKMGKSLIYAPMYFENGSYSIAGHPFILDFDGNIHLINPNHQERTSLVAKRKTSLSRGNIRYDFAREMDRSRIQGSNEPDFVNADTVYYLWTAMEKYMTKETGGLRTRDQMLYDTLWEEVLIDSKKKYRYYRYINREKKYFRVGDMEFYVEGQSEPNTGKIIGSVENPERAFDGTNGYSIIYEEWADDTWVGMDFGKPVKLTKWRFLPAQDRNRILPGHTYQFYYWDEDWILLAEKISDKHEITFDNIPTNTLYRIRCLDCKYNKERPFTIENGRQVWY